MLCVLSCLCVYVSYLSDRSTGKDLNAALKKFEERMTTIQQVQQEFQETRHIFLIFTGGNFKFFEL